jgi:hypothetical protein
VNEGHNGKGLGKQLVNQVAEYAKTNQLNIIAECSYAKKVLEKSEEYKDLLL